MYVYFVDSLFVDLLKNVLKCYFMVIIDKYIILVLFLIFIVVKLIENVLKCEMFCFYIVVC